MKQPFIWCKIIWLVMNHSPEGKRNCVNQLSWFSSQFCISGDIQNVYMFLYFICCIFTFRWWILGMKCITDILTIKWKKSGSKWLLASVSGALTFYHWRISEVRGKHIFLKQVNHIPRGTSKGWFFFSTWGEEGHLLFHFTK